MLDKSEFKITPEQIIISQVAKPQARLILAHGAGADMQHEFMTFFADKLALRQIQVIRFNFFYMQKRLQDGKKRPPDRMPKLQQCYQDVIEYTQQTLEQQSEAPAPLYPAPLYIGGKSMGGRVASLIADPFNQSQPSAHSQISGIVALGFPFHAPGKAAGKRIEHLPELQTPMLIVQGERDSMGSRSQVQEYPLSNAIEIDWLEDGDHSLKPRKRSGFDATQHLNNAVTSIEQFILKNNETF